MPRKGWSGYVYALRHNPTGKIYVGRTMSQDKALNRIKSHLAALKRGKHPVELMQKDFDEFGNDYSYFILSKAESSFALRNAESLYMTILNTRNPDIGYNYKDKTKDFSLKQFEEIKLPIEFPKKQCGRKRKTG